MQPECYDFCCIPNDQEIFYGQDCRGRAWYINKETDEEYPIKPDNVESFLERCKCFKTTQQLEG